MNKFFLPFEIPLLFYLVVTGFLLALQKASGLWGFLGFHFLGIIILISVAWVERRYRRRFWTVLRHWLPILFLLAIFRELTFIIPEIHSFEDFYFDEVLASWDQAVFGDVFEGIAFLWWPPFVEVLHYCYWIYFPMPVILAILFWVRGQEKQYRHFGTVYMTTMILGYFCYMAVPAVGPQHFEVRPDALNGLWFGEWMHLKLRELEMTTADAFPSLHTAAAALALVYAWNTHRAYFWWMLLPGTGLILSTVLLRYHYVVDVVAGLILVPIALFLGNWLYRLCNSDPIEE